MSLMQGHRLVDNQGAELGRQFDFKVAPQGLEQLLPEFRCHSRKVGGGDLLGKGRAAMADFKQLGCALGAGGCWGVGITGDGNQRGNGLARDLPRQACRAILDYGGEVIS
jgi:hypothetical protein